MQFSPRPLSEALALWCGWGGALLAGLGWGLGPRLGPLTLETFEDLYLPRNPAYSLERRG